MTFSPVIQRFVLFLLPGIPCASISWAQSDTPEFFETKVRPVLANDCLACHGASKMGGLTAGFASGNAHRRDRRSSRCAGPS